jgi:hypothetical protein
VAETGVFYLYRFAEGEAPVRRFLGSYRTHPAGLDHDLHIILKGFPNQDALAAARALFRSLPINAIEVDDSGYDIGAYITAAKMVANPKLLFLNTFSEILADNWLFSFGQALDLPGVGLVGATGSWQSASSGYEAAFFKAVRLLKSMGHTAGLDRNEPAPSRNNIRRLLRKLPRAALYPVRLYEFGRHPNPHIRTNAFMIRRDLFLSLRAVALKKKMEAYKFESGRRSMTKQIMARGLRPVVVDRWGKVYEIPEWRSSSTFWIDLQANLLVADNQTAGYAAGGPKRRKLLKNNAWDSPWSRDAPGPK